MSAATRHQHDLLRADLVEWCHGAAVALREQEGTPEVRAQVLRNLRIGRAMLSAWDKQPKVPA